jgi:hypothetical protein
MQYMKTNTRHNSKEFTSHIQKRVQITLPIKGQRGLEPEKKSLKDYFGAFGTLPDGISVEQAIKGARKERSLPR